MSNNSASPSVPTTSKESSSEQLCEQRCVEVRIRLIRKQLEGLFTGYSPDFGSRVNKILQHSPPTDQATLDAWIRIGHGDAVRSPRIDLIRANESTMSPLGVACLISYARGYLDELETIQAVAQRVLTQTEPSLPTIRTSESLESAPSPKQRRSCKDLPKSPQRSQKTRSSRRHSGPRAKAPRGSNSV